MKGIPYPNLVRPVAEVAVIWRMREKESTRLRFHIEHVFRRYFAIVFPLLIVATDIETALIVM
jgi:hypothetical protein